MFFVLLIVSLANCVCVVVSGGQRYCGVSVSFFSSFCIFLSFFFSLPVRALLFAFQLTVLLVLFLVCCLYFCIFIGLLPLCADTFTMLFVFLFMEHAEVLFG